MRGKGEVQIRMDMKEKEIMVHNMRTTTVPPFPHTYTGTSIDTYIYTGDTVIIDHRQRLHWDQPLNVVSRKWAVWKRILLPA